MKAVKRIIAWICISLGMQIAVLYYVDNYLFSTENVSSKIVSTKVEDDKGHKKSNINIEIPEYAQNKSVSCDGQYLAYVENDRLKIVDTYTGDEENIELQEGLHMSYYKWAPDRNILLMAAKKRSEDKSKFIFYSYDAEKGEKTKLQTKDEKETSFTASRETEVQDIELSPFTNMIYIKSGVKDGKSNIHKINIMQKIDKVESEISMIGDMKIIPNDDSIAYEATNKHKVYVTGKSTSLNINGVDKLSLIDVDDNDVVYLGEVENSLTSEGIKVKNIYCGIREKSLDNPKNKDDNILKSKKGKSKKSKVHTNVSYKWNRIVLDKSIDKKDIYVSRNGKVYVNDNLRGVVTELTSKEEVKYKGIFLQMYDGGIASISEGKLVETPLK
ncbi:hypothetical protein IRP63_02405 [Clostridium botulinum]|uniref:Dipeptidyl peptidase IV n=1 Tax=Clostridium botulinum C/D str. DC5 TaxID=1443128 RepID=A0A0A0IFT4_CLOBO|nr:hypothetical protein [Clostridium botulinum]KEI01757.1 hypothetical protein Z952_10805 [Clostridium botulinum C/D str. BKT75002]KEI07427.1 hypothetical protein Z954_03980 [Clostridium botulinum C/D str. BKT2873]KGM93282.1 hypothetical protein Z956_12070 [Clostridium botulinum D str. CCUG 7971]KGM99842.1 hypothetical protein Z955_05870 [Clostridium botulinum C/D str. DC5]KOC49346.1 hypothetical protein ADU88_05850 [Clostridium botulinum]